GDDEFDETVVINVRCLFEVVDTFWTTDHIGDFGTGFDALHGVGYPGTIIGLSNEVIKRDFFRLDNQGWFRDLIIAVPHGVFPGGEKSGGVSSRRDFLHTGGGVVSNGTLCGERVVTFSGHGLGWIPFNRDFSSLSQLGKMTIQRFARIHFI